MHRAQLSAQNDRIIRAIEVLEATLTGSQDLARRMASDKILRKINGPSDG